MQPLNQTKDFGHQPRPPLDRDTLRQTEINHQGVQIGSEGRSTPPASLRAA
jgi:hypothetical protein